MFKFKSLPILGLFLFLGLSLSFGNSYSGGLDFRYHAPEMFFKDIENLKLSVEYEILDCFARERDHNPVNQCVDMEFAVLSHIFGGTRKFIEPLDNSGSCFLGNCEVALKLPLQAILTPLEYEKYLLGDILHKEVLLGMGFWVFKEDFVGKRKFSKTKYILKFVLNPTGFNTVAITKFRKLPKKEKISQIAAGANHTCILTRSGQVKCWGANAWGELGYGNIDTIGDDESPSSVGFVDVGGKVVQIVAGGAHVCALLDDGKVRCWGRNNFGQLGYGNINDIGDDELPSSVGDVDVGGKVIQLAAGGSHTCALLENSKVRCWGLGDSGRLGYENTDNIGDNELPSSAGDVNVGADVVQLSAGGSHTCALLEGGDVRCWGLGNAGQLGYGNTDSIGDNESPASAGNVDVGGEVAKIEASAGTHTCAVLKGGRVRCWGTNFSGQLGYGNLDNIGDDEFPSSAGDVSVGDKVADITAGVTQTCVRFYHGQIKCWGGSALGQLGYGNTDTIGDDELPSTVGTVDIGGRALQVAAGYEHTCSIVRGREVVCWGAGNVGQLGYGNTENVGDDELPSDVGFVDI